MFLTIITDCRDDNARARQEARYAHLFPETNISFIGAKTDIEAGGNVIDLIDASDDSPGVIAVNCAPRHGRAKKWQNGSPFGYVWVNNKLIVGTIDGMSFSFLKKFGLIESVAVTDIQTTLAQGEYTDEQITQAATTQFRSLNYLPRMARIVWDKKDIPNEPLKTEDIPDMPSLVWWIDCFGNCKTSLTAEDINFKAGESRDVKFHHGTTISVPCVERLAEVADHEPALILGSSGLGDKRFVELVVQGGSAAEHFTIQKTDPISIH